MKIATTAEMIRSGGLGEGNAFTIAASSDDDLDIEWPSDDDEALD